MQTTTNHPKLSSQAATTPGAPTRQPLPGSLVMPPPVAKPRPSVTGVEASQTAAMHEMDSMLIDEPNLGAVKGLRVALIFNAGLALSGLLMWEVWTFLAR